MNLDSGKKSNYSWFLESATLAAKRPIESCGKENQSFSLGESDRALLPYWLAAHTDSFLTVYTDLKASQKQWKAGERAAPDNYISLLISSLWLTY